MHSILLMLLRVQASFLPAARRAGMGLLQRPAVGQRSSLLTATAAKPPAFITTPIYYVNGQPHIGHVYTTLAADVVARFMRLDGHEVKFLTGTDEHGQKVEQSAELAGETPIEFADRVSESFRSLIPLYNFSCDEFIRTTEPRHIAAVQALWRELLGTGDIYLGAYEGWYSIRDEAFYTEDELVDGVAPTGAPVEWVAEPSYFFALSKWTEPLIAHIEQNPEFVLPTSRRNEVLSFLRQEGGLRDLSISRTTFNWGVPVPDQPEGAAEQHIMYVWLDALTNYITAAGYPQTDGEDFSKWWPASLHMVGKDILRFHAIYWPAFLLAAGLPLPKRCAPPQPSPVKAHARTRTHAEAAAAPESMLPSLAHSSVCRAWQALCARLVDARWAEDVQVDRQRRRAGRAGRGVRLRPGALLHGQRGRLRLRWRLFGHVASQLHQRQGVCRAPAPYCAAARIPCAPLPSRFGGLAPTPRLVRRSLPTSWATCCTARCRSRTSTARSRSQRRRR